VMIKRTEERLGLKPSRLAADAAYGTGRFFDWLVIRGMSQLGQSQTFGDVRVRFSPDSD
jgi:hypothetical protein